MAAATYDIRQFIDGLNQPQHTRRVEMKWVGLDFSKRGTPGLSANQNADIGTIKKGFVYEGSTVIIRTPEGQTATMNLGTDVTANAFLAAGNINGAANTAVAKTGAEVAAGTYFDVDTPVRVTCPNAANTIDVAVLDIFIWGFMAKSSTG